jgi:hypothetical protein
MAMELGMRVTYRPPGEVDPEAETHLDANSSNQ